MLLQRLVDMWDPDVGHFMVGDQILHLEIEDVYFITRLSHRGVRVVLVRGRWDSSNPLDQYVVQYYQDGARKSNNKLSIQDVMDLTLRTIMFCITHVVGSTGPHLDTRAQVDYAVLCQDGVLYNLSAMLLVNKEQLTRCRIG